MNRQRRAAPRRTRSKSRLARNGAWPTNTTQRKSGVRLQPGAMVLALAFWMGTPRRPPPRLAFPVKTSTKPASSAMPKNRIPASSGRWACHLPFAFSPRRVRLQDTFSRLARVLTAATDRFNFTATRRMEVLASRSVLSRSSSSGVHLFICFIDTKLLPLRPQPSRRTLPALVLPSRVFSTSNDSRSPLRMSSGSMPADCSAVTWRNISGPPASSAMKPKPRAAFHIFNMPVATLLPLRLRQIDPVLAEF